MQFSARKRALAALTVVSMAGIGFMGATSADAATKYTLGASAPTSKAGSTVKVSSKFTASVTATFTIDTEIYNSSGKQITQFDEDLAMTKGKTVIRSYDWKTTGLADGTYTLKQGIFRKNWGSQIEWNDAAGKATLTKAGAATTTTKKPGTTTTTKKPSTGRVDLTDPVKKEAAMQLVSSAENSSLNWKAQYGYIEDIGDGRGYTAGIIGFCSGCGDMQTLVHYYNSIAPGNALQKYTAALDAKGSWDASHDGLGTAFETAWKTAAKDPKFQAAQDHERDRVYFNPAVNQGKVDGLGALGQFIYYDAMVVHGPGADALSFGGIRSAAMKVAKTPAQGGNETTYLNAFMDARNKVMKSEEAHSDVSRIENAQRVFVKNGNLNLDLPLSWSVYGDKYSITKITL